VPAHAYEETNDQGWETHAKLEVRVADWRGTDETEMFKGSQLVRVGAMYDIGTILPTRLACYHSLRQEPAVGMCAALAAVFQALINRAVVAAPIPRVILHWKVHTTLPSNPLSLVTTFAIRQSLLKPSSTDTLTGNRNRRPP
jgi:hypothetical protein